MGILIVNIKMLVHDDTFFQQMKRVWLDDFKTNVKIGGK